MARDKLGINRASNRDTFHDPGERPVERCEPCAAVQRGCASALCEPVLSNQHGQSGREEVYRHAGDQLIAPEGDRGEAVNGGQKDRRGDTGKKAKPNAARDKGDRSGEEGCCQHLSLEPDVEDAGAL